MFKTPCRFRNNTVMVLIMEHIFNVGSFVFIICFMEN